MTTIAAVILAYQVAYQAIAGTEDKAFVMAAIVTKVGLYRFCKTLVT